MGLYDAKLKPELVEYAYLDVLKEYGNPVEIRPEQRSDILSEALRAARLWEKRVAGNLPDPPFLIEETAYCVLYVDEHTMRRVVMQGTADLVSPEQGIIVDWKTSKRPWDQSKADMTIQAEVYCGLMSAKLQQKFHKMHFWVYERGNAKWSKIETTRDDASIESTFKTAVQYGKQMLAGVYPATPTVEQFGKVKRGWYCSTRYCPAWNACEYKFLNDDVNEHDVKIVSL